VSGGEPTSHLAREILNNPERRLLGAPASCIAANTAVAWRQGRQPGAASTYGSDTVDAGGAVPAFKRSADRFC